MSIHSDPSGPDRDRADEQGFDRRLREIHAQAVAATPQRIRLQLRPRRAPVWNAGMRAATVAATFAVGLLAVGLVWQRPAPAPAGSRTASTAPEAGQPANVAQTAAVDTAGDNDAAGLTEFNEAYAALDESPEFYLWLASSDASAFVSSEAVTE